MMHIVLDGAAPEWCPVVRHERKIIADMSLHTDDDAEQHETPVGHGMIAEDVRGSCGENADRDELEGMKVLSNPAVRSVVLVMYSVNMLVQDTYLVMGGVPHIVLKVKHSQCSILMPTEVP